MSTDVASTDTARRPLVPGIAVTAAACGATVAVFVPQLVVNAGLAARWPDVARFGWLVIAVALPPLVGFLVARRQRGRLGARAAVWAYRCRWSGWASRRSTPGSRFGPGICSPTPVRKRWLTGSAPSSAPCTASSYSSWSQPPPASASGTPRRELLVMAPTPSMNPRVPGARDYAYRRLFATRCASTQASLCTRIDRRAEVMVSASNDRSRTRALRISWLALGLPIGAFVGWLLQTSDSSEDRRFGAYLLALGLLSLVLGLTLVRGSGPRLLVVSRVATGLWVIAAVVAVALADFPADRLWGGGLTGLVALVTGGLALAGRRP